MDAATGGAVADVQMAAQQASWKVTGVIQCTDKAHAARLIVLGLKGVHVDGLIPCAQTRCAQTRTAPGHRRCASAPADLAAAPTHQADACNEGGSDAGVE